MKNQYTQYIKQLQELINLEYPSQKRYPGIIQDIYKLTECIGRGETTDEVSFFSLARRFVDETMDYFSCLKTVGERTEQRK